MENNCIQNTRSSAPAADSLSGSRGVETTATVKGSLSAPDWLGLPLSVCCIWSNCKRIFNAVMNHEHMAIQKEK